MESLLEYNQLMNEAGLGHLAKKQLARHKPNPDKQLPEYMMTATVAEKRTFLLRKSWRESAKTRRYLKKYRSERVVCECGATISKPNIHVHQKTVTCKKKIQRLQQKNTKPVTTNHAFVCSILAQSAALEEQQQEEEEVLLQPPL